MRRRGATRGLVAVAHSLLLVIYHVLERDTEYHDLNRSSWIVCAKSNLFASITHDSSNSTSP